MTDERLPYILLMSLSTTVMGWFVHPWIGFGAAVFWAVNLYYAMFIEPVRHPPKVEETLLTEEQRQSVAVNDWLKRETARELKWKQDIEERLKAMEGHNGN